MRTLGEGGFGSLSQKKKYQDNSLRKTSLLLKDAMGEVKDAGDSLLEKGKPGKRACDHEGPGTRKKRRCLRHH